MQDSVSTNRLLLNILTADDYQFIIELVNSKGWLKFIGDRNVHTKDEAIVYINKIIATENLFYWVVRTKNEKVPVGIISFIKRQYLDHFDIGFAFLPRYYGHGYAFEAVTEILSLVRNNPKYNPVLATTMPENENSIKLLIKLGFHFEKELMVGNQKILLYTTPTE